MGAQTPPILPPIDELRALEDVSAFIFHAAARRYWTALIDELAQLREEVHFWRANAAATLSTAVMMAEAAARKGDTDEEARILVSTILPQSTALRDALAGDYHEYCESCGKPLLDGQPVVSDVDCGDIHAQCVGASPAEIEAGEMWVNAASLDASDGPAATRTDGKGRLAILVRAGDYTPDRISQQLAAAQRYHLGRLGDDSEAG